MAKVGYVLQPGRGKRSHTYWRHPLPPEEPLTIPPTNNLEVSAYNWYFQQASQYGSIGDSSLNQALSQTVSTE